MVFQGLEKDRHAQDITLYCMALESELEGFSDESCKSLWMESPIWQPTREVVELLMASRDWGEINFVINLIYEPLLAALFSRDLVMRFAPRHGDPVTSVIAEGAENDRKYRQLAASALAKFLIEQDAENLDIMEGWVALWAPRVFKATAALAPLFGMADIEVDTFDAANTRVTKQWAALMADIGLKTAGEVAA